MARKRGRKPVKQVALSPGNDFNLADKKELQIEKQEAQSTDLDVDRVGRGMTGFKLLKW